MAGNVSPIPQGYHSISPALTCKDAASAIEFYKEAFGATEIMRMAGPGGSIGHAELRIGDSVIADSSVLRTIRGLAFLRPDSHGDQVPSGCVRPS